MLDTVRRSCSVVGHRLRLAYRPFLSVSSDFSRHSCPSSPATVLAFRICDTPKDGLTRLKRPVHNPPSLRVAWLVRLHQCGIIPPRSHTHLWSQFRSERKIISGLCSPSTCSLYCPSAQNARTSKYPNRDATQFVSLFRSNPDAPAAGLHFKPSGAPTRLSQYTLPLT